MWRPAAIGTLAVLLLAFTDPDCRAQDRTPQPPAPNKAASDFLTADDAASILGTSVEARGVGPLQCWYVQSGYSGRLPADKSVRIAISYWAAPLADDYALKKQLYADFPSPNATVTELHDFADAALWIWKPSAGGTLFAFRGGTIQVEVTLTGFAEDATLQKAKALAAKVLGGSDDTGYAYVGTPKGDAALVSLAAIARAIGAAPEAEAQAADATPTAPSEPSTPATPTDAPADAPAADVAPQPQALPKYCEATYITPSGFLHELKEVSLALSIPSYLSEYVTEDEARAQVTEALAAYGISVVPMAFVQADVKLLYYRMSVDWGGEVYHTHEFMLSVDFITRIAVRRHGTFHVMYAAVAGDRSRGTIFEANEIRKAFFGDELTPEMKVELPSLLHDVLGSIAGNTNVDTAHWCPTDWSEEKKAAADAEFIAAISAESPPGKRFDDIDSRPLYSPDRPADGGCTGLTDWPEMWRDAFDDWGWVKEAATVESPLLLTHYFGCEYIDTYNVPNYYRMTNIMQLKESNAAFVLNGRIRRKPAALISWFVIDAALDQDIEQAQYAIDDRIEDAIWDVEAAME